MILITGWSHKLDGIAFIADTDDHATALKMMCEAWNSRFTEEPTKIVVTGNEDYLLFAEVENTAVAEFEDEVPRREGWQLVAQEVKPGEIIQRCPW